MTTNDTARAVERVWRLESSRLLGALLRITRDLDRAEDLAQEALAAALAQWPAEGVPDNPGAWLMTAAKRRAINHLRSGERQLRAYATLAAGTAEAYDEEFAVDRLEDDVLRLMFVCCHPSLTDDTRTVLTLRLVAGLTTREIARAYLTSEATVATRISRAKRTLHTTVAALEEPTGAERIARLASVMSVIYLLFNEGYAATAGIDWTRPALCAEAVRLAALLITVTPREPEAYGLLALLELQSSRLTARIDPAGHPVLLTDQDRRRWDRSAISRGDAALRVALSLGGGGPYVLQAAIAAEHARASSVETTDWARIAALYGTLHQATGSAVVELNRAVAVAMAQGPQAGLTIVDEIEPALPGFHLVPAVRGDLLARLGHYPEAAAQFDRAAELAANGTERALMKARADTCRQRGATAS
ncbi:RNA polymerase sigma factor [Phytohabitans houttuyneae]|uniref:RNA polymerase sigma factor n=1 Tax=Phytohabitans houttuyneae TaxID=1076126 RepID=A0A6V8KM41_9ACTN|nr:sigma-70 family RNA polymerase sigma factor [Phytohabitans houttuyneae]GFJ83588.1 RNA polymerase sigma factor [Phytohabitans houttuyneae]